MPKPSANPKIHRSLRSQRCGHDFPFPPATGPAHRMPAHKQCRHATSISEPENHLEQSGTHPIRHSLLRQEIEMTQRSTTPAALDRSSTPTLAAPWLSALQL